MSYYKLTISLFGFLIVGCTSENAENLYPTNDAEAKSYYNTNLKEIINNKCISCHSYHIEGASRYDTYEKTKSNIVHMISRIESTSNIVMPPLGELQLTVDEKNSFQEFLNILNSNTNQDIITINWTAYKYLNFDDRAPVSGTFNTIIEYTLNDNPLTPLDLLKNAEIIIDASSVNVGNEPEKTQNVASFFAAFTSEIKGIVDTYTADTASVTFYMNNIEQQVLLDVTLEADKITLSGTIEDMALFNWQSGYNALNAVCGTYHENMVWPDIDINIEIAIN